MPELPEVETTRRGIAGKLTGTMAIGAIVRHPRLRWPVPEHLSEILAGQSLLDIRRRAKYLLLVFERGTLLIHLGMSGSLRVLTENFPPEKHDHIDLLFSGNLCLRYHDPRRFGSFHWTVDDPQQHMLLHHLGAEPLSDNFTAEYLEEKLSGKLTPVKIAIMDQRIVVGVGNIYAAEALFRACILPQRASASLTLSEIMRLVEAIRSILTEAILAGGSTLRDYVDSDGHAGYFTTNNHVYGRAEQPCRICATPLLTARQGQRATVWCPCCQH